MNVLNRLQPSALHHRLLPLVRSSPSCYCEDSGDFNLVLHGPYPPVILCSSCWKSFGPIPTDQWERLHAEILTIIHYTEATVNLRVYQQNHPNQEVLMTDETGEATQVQLPPNLIKAIPGHIVFKTQQEAADGSNCAHRWIITEDNRVKCILCDGERVLTPEELKIIETAEQAGVVFLKWPERFKAMERTRGSKRRRGKRGKGVSKATGGVKVGTEVPEGYLPVAEAAAQLGTTAKKLRKSVRSGLYSGTKVGGRVFVKISE